VGRVIVIGGCSGEDHLMVGAPSLVANAAFRSGSGLVQMIVPADVRASAAVLAPCATTRALPRDAKALLQIIDEFNADVVAVGPGLGDSLPPDAFGEFLVNCTRPLVIDADGLTLIARLGEVRLGDPRRVILTPHPGEAKRLLGAAGTAVTIDRTPASRRAAALAIHERYGCTVALKGRGTIVTNGQRLYINGTGNAGMATGGAGDVLTGIIAALIGGGVECFEATILAVYLHGLAGDFAAEELGRYAMTALDIIEYLPEAFSEHEMTANE
jgi:NAD(P)H-hydrate epimerase